MCLDRMQNCIIEQQFVENEDKENIHTLTKCDLIVDKAKEIDKLWRTYNSAIYRMKWWNRISTAILYINIILSYTCPQYAVGAYGIYAVIAVSNIAVKRLVN